MKTNKCKPSTIVVLGGRETENSFFPILRPTRLEEKNIMKPNSKQHRNCIGQDRKKKENSFFLIQEPIYGRMDDYNMKKEAVIIPIDLKTKRETEADSFFPILRPIKGGKSNSMKTQNEMESGVIGQPEKKKENSFFPILRPIKGGRSNAMKTQNDMESGVIGQPGKKKENSFFQVLRPIKGGKSNNMKTKGAKMLENIGQNQEKKENSFFLILRPIWINKSTNMKERNKPP